jgi:threonine synthase
MILHSTAGRSPSVTFREALLRGLASDGGLYLPTAMPHLDPDTLRSWRPLSFSQLAVRLASGFLSDEFPADVLERLVGDALSFPAPTVKTTPRHCILELFHGPTLAFKDFGARFLARFFGHLLDQRGAVATILVATSGDTGSAVAHGFYGVPGVRVVVLYPRGKISPFQEAQMATLGGNITALRVPGTFDDCQRLVKEAFLDPDLDHLELSSANSINIGRLLPQMFYYIASYLAVADLDADEVAFSVPSGNLGNLTAGVMAQRTGIRVSRFVASCNINDVLPEFLQTGVYRARPSVETLSNAMDVGDPSNFPRLLEMHAGSKRVLRDNILGTVVTDEETRSTIRRVYETTGYVLDPHGAVAYLGAERLRMVHGFNGITVALATAHPAKFAAAIESVLGFEPELPPQYRDWATRKSFAEDLDDTTYPSFRRVLERAVPNT